MLLLVIHYLHIDTKNKHDYHRSKDCIKNFSKDLKH